MRCFNYLLLKNIYSPSSLFSPTEPVAMASKQYCSSFTIYYSELASYLEQCLMFLMVIHGFPSISGKLLF